MKIHINIKIYGKVQGVSFRYWAWMKARTLGLTGFIQNESDGSVYIEAEGEEKIVDDFLSWCYQGSPLAEVKRIDYSYQDYFQNFQEFAINRKK